ncbi:kinase-like protein [Amniculicola lignicola CBS 123094]|uniref:EKC/KEOPS complex subunit BUD32 n=1 Tax=Amniculicola lignicola CBS 123094 TaxID=1392246 RepID=A0A6A5W2S0_9PLEO|nr:kinase-like protein [Amniculicola lignicola CBS 123094]
MLADDIQYPAGYGLEDVVGWGTTGLVVLDESSKTIIKTPFDPFDQDRVRFISQERRIYERLTNWGGHKGILSYHGTFESGIRLEYAPNHDLRSFIKNYDVNFQQKLRWASQIAEAIKFIHGAGIIHGDLTCANIFLDENLNAKLADFAGSSMDGSPLLVVVTASHEYPGPLLSFQGDIFSFGCVLYEIMTADVPYKELSDRDIRAQFLKGKFPDTISLEPVRSIINKCWQGEYSRCEIVIEELREQQESDTTLLPPPAIIRISILVVIVITAGFLLRSSARSRRLLS